MTSRRTLLVISQVYRPDLASAGQYLADVSEEMVRRGWRVIVLCANRGYDSPAERYASRDSLAGVEVIRLPFSSFGKRSIATRIVGGMLFVMQSIARALALPRIDALLVSTAPPMAPIAALVLRAFRGLPVVYWIMDLNPDQYVALGYSSPKASLVRLMDWMNRAILRAASGVVVLDRYMAGRVLAKWDVSNRLRIIPPWSRDEQLKPVAHEANPFRELLGASGQFVVMYSGNHGPTAPLATLLAAAKRLRDDPRFLFVFIGGGVDRWRIESAAAECGNIIALSYQPPETLRFSLSAADVHAVPVGDDMIGIVHTSKLYGAFAVARPVLVIGPQASPAGEIVSRYSVGWHAEHGDAGAIVGLLLQLVEVKATTVADTGRRSQQLSEQLFGMTKLRGDFCDFLEASVASGQGLRRE